LSPELTRFGNVAFVQRIIVGKAPIEGVASRWQGSISQVHMLLQVAL
jgi:hypothetical protein